MRSAGRQVRKRDAAGEGRRSRDCAPASRRSPRRSRSTMNGARARARGAEYPLGVRGHREPARPCRAVAQASGARSSRGRPAARTGAARARRRGPGARSGCNRSRGARCRAPLSADRLRRGGPDFAGVFVAHVIASPAGRDRIVRPRRQLVLAAVARPGVAAALGRRPGSRTRVGDDVDPGRRRRAPGLEDVTYSLPSGSKPPRPLKNSRSCGGSSVARPRRRARGRRRQRGSAVRRSRAS